MTREVGSSLTLRTRKGAHEREDQIARLYGEAAEEPMRNCEEEPIPVGEARGKSWWFYKGALYSMSEEDLVPADVEALIEEQQNKKKLKIARAAIQRARPEQKRAAQFGAT